jgi:hypothetical protein
MNGGGVKALGQRIAHGATIVPVLDPNTHLD